MPRESNEALQSQLRHPFTYFPPNSRDIAYLLAEFNAASCLDNRDEENRNIKYIIKENILKIKQLKIKGDEPSLQLK